MSVKPPRSPEALRNEIVRRYEQLSPRLKQVAKFVLENPNDVALQTLAVIAARSKVQPSTIVRFAKTFGYEGASGRSLRKAPWPLWAVSPPLL